MRATALVDDMGVHNIGFLIENLGADAAELQYLRELVQNAFESIAASISSVRARSRSTSKTSMACGNCASRTTVLV